MRRKVNLVGHSTHTVSLPNKWIKANRVQKGHELHVVESGQDLVVSASLREPAVKRIELSLDGVAKSMINRIVAACYKAGYQEIVLVCESTDQLSIAQRTVERTYMGYDLEYLSSKKVLISSVTALDVAKFDTMERKYFLAIKTMISEMANLVSKKNYSELPNVVLMDKQIDMYSDFLRRIVNQGLLKVDNIPVRYYFYEQLEIIADAFKDVIKTVLDSKSIPKSVAATLFGIKELFDQLESMYFKFSLQKVSAFCEFFESTFSELQENANSSKQAVFTELYFITRSIFECKGALLTLRLQ